MTATDELRRLLDERGVEWRETALGETRWLSTVLNGNASAKRINDKLVLFTGYKLITPEQAIAATLGSSNCTNSERTNGTCHDTGDPSDFCCSECGVRMFTDTSDTYTMIASDGCTIIKHPNYCPNCGAKVVEPTANDVDAEVDA